MDSNHEKDLRIRILNHRLQKQEENKMAINSKLKDVILMLQDIMIDKGTSIYHQDLITTEKFKKANCYEKVKLAKLYKVCYKCLGRHKRGECRASNCICCGGSHNILLCYQWEEMENNRSQKTKNHQQKRDDEDKDWEGNPQKTVHKTPQQIPEVEDWLPWEK